LKEDTRTSIFYDDEGRIIEINRLLLESNNTGTSTYNYENGLLSSITGNDAEFPTDIFIRTITRDSQNRITAITTVNGEESLTISPSTYVYLYDDNGNVSERQFQDEAGNIIIREVFTYEATEEAVANLVNVGLYFIQ